MNSKQNSFPESIKIGDTIYTYVWGDEFDGDILDSSKWTWSAEKSGMQTSNVDELAILDDERAITVKDGVLRLTSSVINEKEDGSKQYGSPASVGTREKMSYVYGYCEIRAKIPFGKGLWPGFWAVSDKYMFPEIERKYITEIDIFEVFGTLDGVVPNIHKWYRKDVYPYDEIHGVKCKNHTQFNLQRFCGNKNKIYFFGERKSNITNLNNEFHTYGFEWTPEEMSMYVDGEKYMTYDITKSYDDCNDINGLHEPIFIMFNNHLFVSSGDFIPEFEKGVPTVINDCEENLPSVYEIEYFRLYQNKALPSSKLFVFNN